MRVRIALLVTLLLGGLVVGCRGGNAPVLTPVEQTAQYAVQIASFTEVMQTTVVASQLPNDVKAKAQAGFLVVGANTKSLGLVLTSYDAAIKLGQPVDPTGPVTQAEQIKAGLLGVVTVVRGGDPALAAQLDTTYKLVVTLIEALQTRLKQPPQVAPAQ